MATPSFPTKLIQAGVLTVAILAAVSLSTEAQAWGRRAGGGHAFADAGVAADAGQQRGKWKGKFARPAGGPAATNAGAGAGGWRARLQQHQAGATGQAPAAAGGWRSRLHGGANPAAMTASPTLAPEPKVGTRSGTYTTQHGGSGTFTQDYTRGQGTSTRDNSVTNANGQTAGWTTQQSVTHGQGSVTGSTNVTGDNGKTYYSGSTTLNAKNDTLTKTETGPAGQTHSVTLQGDGTPRDGNRSGTYTTGSGKTGTYDQQVSYANGTITRDNTVTNADGKTASWQAQVSGSHADGVTSVDKTVTGQNGKTESWDTSYDKNDGQLTHTYTGPGGNTYGGTATFNK